MTTAVTLRRPPFLGIASLVWLLVMLVACSGGHKSAAPPSAANSQPSGAVGSGSGAVQVAWDHSKAKVPVTAAQPSWGRPDAPVTLVEFSDLQCPFCSRGELTVEELQRLYGPDKLRVVFRHAPLPFHDNARPAAIAAATVHGLAGNEAFFGFVRRAFGHQRELSLEAYEGWAVEVGLTAQAFREAYVSKRFEPMVDADIDVAQQLGVQGTPNFRVNGIEISGAQPLEAFQAVIDAQLREAEALRAAGTPSAQLYVALTDKNSKAVPAPPEKKAANEDDLTVWRVAVEKDDPSQGPSDALVTIVQWSDYQCPFCRRVEGTLTQLRQNYPKDVRIVWKDNPLPFHPAAKPAAVLGRLVYERQGNAAFWKLHDSLFGTEAQLTEAAVQSLGEKAGIHAAELSPAVRKSKALTRIEASMEQAADLNANGTPHFFINGVRLTGAQPIEAFRRRIDAELRRAKELTDRGVPRAQIYAELMKAATATANEPEKKDVPTPAASRPSKGPAAAPVVLQLWSDFQCPFCARVEPTITELQAEFPRELRVVWRHLPLNFHQHALLAAEAAEEVLAQKGPVVFWKYHDLLFAAQGRTDGLVASELESMAARLGVDLPRFRTALEEHRHRPAIDADLALAEKAGIRGTPAAVINGYFVGGAQPLVNFRRAVKRALADKAPQRK